MFHRMSLKKFIILKGVYNNNFWQVMWIVEVLQTSDKYQSFYNKS